MNPGILVFYSADWQPLADVTLPNIRQYAARHGYSLTVHCGTFGDPSRLIGFQKTDLARALLPNFSSLWVIDLDLIVTNQAIRFESFMDNEHDFFICTDSNYGLNAGSYIVRNTPAAQAFLSSVIHYPVKEGECEQNAIQEILKHDWFNDLSYFLPHPSINSYEYRAYGETKTREEGQWRKSDFVLHLPGMSTEQRLKIIKETEVV